MNEDRFETLADDEEDVFPFICQRLAKLGSTPIPAKDSPETL